MGLLTILGVCTGVPAAASDEALIDETLESAPRHSPEWAETAAPPPGPPSRDLRAFGPVAPAVRQPAGALSGRIVFMNCGHGWIFAPDYWRLQRPTLQEMNEDYGNIDQLNMFAAYCFNAGAIVVPFRPLGRQTREVVLDNDSPGVAWAGSWANSTSTVFYGSAGDVPYRYASLAATETATATYTPNFPEPGFYPVYTWVRHGSDRGDQLYRIRHTGGESHLRIPHHMVGNGWVYLGEYYFKAGSDAAAGAVVISNLRGTPTGTYTFADAVRFGNGMGSVVRGAAVSGYPREDEGCRYWIQNSLGQGQDPALYDGAGNDESDGWSAPPKMSAEMNREQAGSSFQSIHISFHSNAGGGRGVLGLITSDPTTNQAALAQRCGSEVNNDLVALGSPPLELPWFNRSSFTYTGGYSEIDGSLFNYEMDATIIEVAFHDSADDARLLRDPKARAAVGKAAMHAVVKFMNQFDGGPLSFLPEPPVNVRASGAIDGSITLRWSAPVSSGGSGPPTGYLVYRSTDGYGFGDPVVLGNVTTHTFAGLPAETDFYFRVAAVNAGGESQPSETVGCRAPISGGPPRVLVVNAFDRLERTGNLRQNTTPQAWVPPGATGTIERVWPRRNNSFDYVVSYGKAIAGFGYPFDSCQNEAIANESVALGGFEVVVWACGQESIADETFSATEQTRVAAFREGGGHLFVSGSEIAWDLDRTSGPNAADRAFFNTHLKADLSNDASANSGSYTATADAAGILAGRGSVTIDDGSKGIYRVKSPALLTPLGAGVRATLAYAGNANGAAAVQYDGSAGDGRVVHFGFPFESIVNSTTRTSYMAGILAFLTVDDLLLPPGSTWRYRDTGIDPPVDWTAPSFDDSGWSEGFARLGYGGDGEITVVSAGPDPQNHHRTTWFRRAFTVPEAGALQALRIDFQRDDGLVVFLNGSELLRDNLASGPLTAATFATTAISGAAETQWTTRFVSANALVPGTNLLAAEVHQSAAASSDLGFDLRLAGLASAALTFADWQKATLGTDAANPIIANDAAELDHDGLPNLLEYALGGNPNIASTTLLPVSILASDRFLLAFERTLSVSDLILTVQASEDLTSPWVDLASSVNGEPMAALRPEVSVVETGSGATRLVEVSEFFPSGRPAPTRRFFRLHVER